jgi:hypothetical protein
VIQSILSKYASAPQSPYNSLMNDITLSRHHGPVDRLIGSPIAEMQEPGRGVEQASHFFQIAFTDRRGDRFSLG